MPSTGKLINRFGSLVCLRFLLKVRGESHHAGFSGGGCKNRVKTVSLGFFFGMSNQVMFGTETVVIYKVI